MVQVVSPTDLVPYWMGRQVWIAVFMFKKGGAGEKAVLAWWLCRHTTARWRWVSERLGMEDESRVTQAIGRVQRGAPRQLARMKSRLERVYQTHNEAA